MKIPVLEYYSARSYNRSVFLIEHGEVVKTFGAINSNFSSLLHLVGTKRDSNGKSYVSLIPFVFLLQRQAESAFEALSAYQSYQAWVLLRPGIESALIVGKWVDDPQNANIWRNRESDRHAYQNTYTGKRLRSRSLPNSDAIQSVLGKINDGFVHANPDFYRRHLDIELTHPDFVKMLLQYFDEDTLLLANVFAFLHLLLVVQQALLSLLNALFSCDSVLLFSMELFARTYNDKINELSNSSEEHRRLLQEFGMWK
jgi:hypothetical protein